MSGVLEILLLEASNYFSSFMSTAMHRRGPLQGLGHVCILEIAVSVQYGSSKMRLGMRQPNKSMITTCFFVHCPSKRNTPLACVRSPYLLVLITRKAASRSRQRRVAFAEATL